MDVVMNIFVEWKMTHLNVEFQPSVLFPSTNKHFLFLIFFLLLITRTTRHLWYITFILQTI